MLHQVYLSFGANFGDRPANILQAVQYVQTRASIKKLSPFYETEPVEYANYPKFLNIVCELKTDLSPGDLLDFLKRIEKWMGRREALRNAAPPIGIDILFYDELSLDSPDLHLPHPCLHERPFVLVPLAEIAPDLVHPALHMTVREMLNKVDQGGVKRMDRSLNVRIEHDIQQSKPTVPLSLSRAGVTNLRRIIQIADGGRGVLFYAELDLFADVNPEQSGVHMSRFSDVVETIVEEISLAPSPDIESLAERLAQQVVQTQGAIYSEVHIRARSPMMKVTPLTGKPVEALYTLIGIAACTQDHTKRLVGIESEGMTVCPCAQDMVKNYSKDLLVGDGFSAGEADRIIDLIPMASHNQRGRGTLLIGDKGTVRAENLVHIVEASMSSETYELLKRPDEFFIVNKAHRNPRFVEDVVREMLRNVVVAYSDLPDEAFVLAKQENFEGIHQHNAFAERFGRLGEVRREIMRGEHVVRHTTLAEWLKE
jgi:GTP cyclohydrolase-4